MHWALFPAGTFTGCSRPKFRFCWFKLCSSDRKSTTVPQMILWIVLYLPLRWELDKSKEFNKLNKSLGYRINASSPSNSNVPSSDRPPCSSVIPSQPTIHSATFFKTPFKSSTKYTERLIYLLEFREKNIKQHKHWLYKIQNKLPHLKTTGQFKDLKITAHYS